MRQRERKHIYIRRMRNPESDRAATRRILREMRETIAALDAADRPQASSLRDVVDALSSGEAWRTNRDESWEQMPAVGREWPNESDQPPMTPREAGVAAGLYNYPDEHLQNVARYVAEDPDILSGVPCFAGTRVPVDIVLAFLDKGMSLTEVRKHYAFVTPAHVAAARAYMASSTRQSSTSPAKGDA